MALADFKAEKCWRFWSAADAGVHYAVYQFADMARLDAALKSDAFKGLVKDFDEAWPSGVTLYARHGEPGRGKERVGRVICGAGQLTHRQPPPPFT